ncbi:MAG: ATP-dependent DNA helicase RecG [Bacillota bacterium]|uniref:ATP-dependent DNA helicase RecG n=1 Tax=Desulforudis sp. DRI-14 TaxID=3459793 RepID=UPI0034822133
MSKYRTGFRWGSEFMADPFAFAIQYLKGVGPSRARLLARLGVFTVGDLLYYFPRRYEDRRVASRLVPEMVGEIVTASGIVLGGEDYQPRRGLKITKFALDNGTGVFYATWFNQPYVFQQLRKGTRVFVVGRLRRFLNSYEIAVQEHEVVEGDDLLSAGRIVPVYASTDRLPQKTLRRIIRQALDEWAPSIGETLSDSFLERYGLPRVPEALEVIHFPSSLEKAAAARRRFACEELLLLQLALARKRLGIGARVKAHRHGEDGPLVAGLLEGLPFTLTGAQKRVWREISLDMQQGRPMQRLLQGDVGSGKTVIAALALLKAVENGHQGAMMAPTEILAEQHCSRLREMLGPLGVKVGYLVGGLRPAERRAVLDDIASGAVQVVVGTHALIQDEVRFRHLGLVVIDEQHRFGVRQRMLLQGAGHITDTLVMTATPIPRTLALTLYGDLDVSVLDEMPPGRLPVKTRLVASSRLNDVWGFVRREARAGRQVYVVCPLVEESESLQVRAASELAERLSKEVLPDLRLDLLHGRMKGREKDAVMQRFRSGETQVLVATTVIEVGVDVPAANTIIILDAERFGLAQLHQLRGRVGRGNEQGWCLLVSDARTPETRERLQALCSTTDGFKLAEIDLQLRGPGDFFGTRQSGLPELKVADLGDTRLIARMQQEAREILLRDPNLQSFENHRLSQALVAKYGDFLQGLGMS